MFCTLFNIASFAPPPPPAPTDSTVLEDAGIEYSTLGTSVTPVTHALAIRLDLILERNTVRVQEKERPRKQGCGSGFESAWMRIIFGSWILDPDPDTRLSESLDPDLH